MALTDLGMFADLEDEEGKPKPVGEEAPVPLPRPRPATPTQPATPVTPESNPADLGMFADVPDAPKDDTFLGGATRAAQNVVHAAIDPIASVPAALELAARGGQNATGYKGEEKVEDTLGFKTTKFLQGLADLVGEADPNDQSMVQQVASGVGSVVGIGAPSLVTSMFASPVAGVAVGAGLGSAQMSVQMFEEARQKGADEDTALLYGGAGGLIGLTDIIPIGHALKFLPPTARKEATNQFMKTILSIAGSAGEEAVQEYGQQVAQNLAANGILKEDRQWDQDALNSAIVGVIVGVGMGSAGSFIPTKQKGVVEDVTEVGPTKEETAALSPSLDPATPVTAPSAGAAADPDVAAAMETPADRAKRISKERARKVLEEKRAAGVVPEIAAEIPADSILNENVTDDSETGTTVTSSPETIVPPVEPAPVEPVPGADTALDEDVPVTAESNPVAAVAPEETVPTVPESPETIEIQREALKGGKRMAVLYPWGTAIPPEFTGTRIRRVHIPSVGIIDYDSRQVNGATVRGAAKLGKLNELLGLGPSSKADVAQSMEEGNPEVAVTERTPDGVEVKAAAGTTETAPAQLDALEGSVATPGNTVQVETPAEVIEARQSSQEPQELADVPTQPEVAPGQLEAPPAAQDVPLTRSEKLKVVSKGRSKAKIAPKSSTGEEAVAKRVDEAKKEIAGKAAAAKAVSKARTDQLKTAKPDERVEAKEIINQQREESQYIRERARAANKGPKETAGKNWKTEQKEDRAKNNDGAKKVVAEFAPIGKTEEGFLGRDTQAMNARAVIKSRATAMVEAAEKAGVSIPDRPGRKVTDESMNHNEEVILLNEARRLARNNSPGADDFTAFVTREMALRSGDREGVLAERSFEGDQKRSTAGSKSTDNIAAAPVTSEVTEEAAPDDAVSADKLAPKLGDDDVQTKAGKSSTMGVRGLNSEGAASGEKLSAETKAILIAKMNAALKNTAGMSLHEKVENLSVADPSGFLREVEMASIMKGLSDDEVRSMDPLEILAVSGHDAKSLSAYLLDTADRLRGGDLYEKWQRLFVPAALRRIARTIPDVKIYVVDDYVVGLIHQNAAALYDSEADHIVMKASTLKDPVALYHIFIHEAAHAMFFHRLRVDRKLNRQMQDILDHVRADFGRPPADGKWGVYGLTNIDEFMSEAWSNPRFQERISNIPVPRSLWGSLPQPRDPVLRNVLNWIKAQIHRLFGTFRPETSKTAFEVAMDVGGAILEDAPKSRADFYSRLSTDATGDMSPIQRMEAEPAPKTTRDKLEAAGLAPDDADVVAELIKEEFGGTVTDEELAALAGEFSKPVTSESDLGAKVDVTPPGGKDVVESVAAGDMSKKTKTRTFFLKVMTLDFIRQKYGHLFVGKDGTRHLDNYIAWAQRRGAIVNKVAHVHDRDAANFIEYSRKHPAEATALADLAMDATRYDVNLGPSANNDHLGKASKRGLQAKQHLAALQARYDVMPAEAKRIYEEMTKNYRASHNDAKRKLAGNVLDMLDLKLSTKDRTDLIEKVVNGTLTEADKATVGSPTVFRALKNAGSLRAIHGAYFPQMRFGDHVVVTTEKIDPPPTKRLMVFGKSVPVTTEVTGNVVRFTADQSIRGVAAELDRQVSDYVATHDLRSLRVSRRFKDRKTGEFVSKGDQIAGHDYDLTYEVELQTKGVHYFESKRDAEKFRKASTSHKTSEVLARRDDETANVTLEGTDVGAIISRIDARSDLSAGERSVMKKALEEAVVASMPGNRSPARYQARRNVLGASKDIGRAAAVYGRVQGNFMATLETAPKMRDEMKALGEVERDVYAKNAGAVSQVMNEVRRRMDGIENPDKPNELAQTISTISFFDKLASPAASVVNTMQVSMNTGPVLGGRYGNARAATAILSAYHRMGAIGTIARGVGNSAKAIAKWRTSAIDTSDVLGSVRKKLGPKYDGLLNELISRGALDENAGFEIAQAVMEKKGVVRSNIARFDRAVRQLPNAVEVVNRVVSAVATYDLARKGGKSETAATQEAFDVVMNTQGDYRAVNTPKFMKVGVLSFAMQFRKFALLQTQLYADMYARITHGATVKEKAVAAKQMMNLMAMQVLVGGAMGLPGLELIKIGVTLAGMMGLSDDDWEDWQQNMQDLLGSVVGADWANLISNGVVTRAIGVDVSSRMSQADLWTGFAPDKLDVKGITGYIGGIFLGAPGQTVLDWTVKAPQKLRDGDVAGALEALVPVKTLADTVKAWRKYDGGEFNEADAALQAFGFKSARQADADTAKSRDYNDKADLKKEADGLREDYKKATTNGEKARIKSLIRDYNKRKKPEGVGNISLDNLTKKDTSP